MIDHNTQTHALNMPHFRRVAGVTLILAGAVIFLDRFLKTGWLSIMILPAIGLFLYLWGARLRHTGLILAGGLLTGLGTGSLAALGPGIQFGRVGMFGALSGFPASLVTKAGLIALYFGIAWGVILLTLLARTAARWWWMLIPSGVFGGLGYILLLTHLHWTDFTLYLALGVGLPLLLWGLITRLFGLVIPGALLIGIGPGIYYAWHPTNVSSVLVNTGIMLIWFAGGWALIILAARWITHQFIWWPLIPGGILGMVGMGLYIGGDPTHALGLISNTGSIALVIFGLYLLLMRKSIHH